MVGFIIAGHGNFASGLYSACKILIGERENIEVIEYIADENINDLDKKINTVIGKLNKKYDKIIIFTDIFDGTPFNRIMVRCIRDAKKFFVISGANLPILIEGVMQAENCRGDYDRVVLEMKERFPSTFIEGISKLKSEMQEYEVI